MKDLIEKIEQIGITDDLSMDQVKKVHLLNKLNFVLGFMGIPYAILFLVSGIEYGFILVLNVLINFGNSILVKKRIYFLAKNISIFLPGGLRA